MARISENFPDRDDLLPPSDLEEDREYTVKIVTAAIEKMKAFRSNHMELKTVIGVEFSNGTRRRLKLNDTNMGHCVDAFGDETNDWVGRRVILSTRWFNIGGEDVRGIIVTPFPGDEIADRVRAFEPDPPRGRKRGGSPDLNDEIPF